MTTMHHEYFQVLTDRLDWVRGTQADAIHEAATLCADSIEADGLVFTFGTGHGGFAALECFPRTGTIAGFRPIVETPIALMHHVFGDMGTKQYRFLHKQEGYGNAILAAHQLDPVDTIILFSHSGMNAVILDIAVECRQRGMKVIGVTSLPHSSSVESRHSSGKRLYEVADVTIDTNVPRSDAGIGLDGTDALFGPTSTSIAVAIAHAIVGSTAEALLSRGIVPKAMINPNSADYEQANANNDLVYADLWRRLSSR